MLNIKNKINLKFDYSQFSDIIQKVPLKYYILKLEEEYFEIHYVFKFMKVIEKENITQKECMEYFKKRKYLLDKSFDGKVKGEYFEMSARFFIEFQNALPAKIGYKMSVKSIVGMEIIENEDNRLLNIIYNSKNEILEIVQNSPKKEKKDLETIKEFLNKNQIDTKQKLNEKYANKKNINYYFMNQALNYKDEKEMQNKIKLEEKKGENVEGEEKQEDKNEGINKMKNGNEKKVINEALEKSDINTNINKKDIKMLKHKRKRGKKSKEKYYIKDISKKSILLNQEDVNYKTLDQAFIFGEKDNKKFLGLQMKCLSNKVNHSTLLKSINKENIKQNCQNILLRCKLDFNFQIQEWHYILVAYYNKKEVDNIYCKQLAHHCKVNDIEIVYFDPEEQKLYNKEFKAIDKIKISKESNLDYDSPKSNPYNIFFCDEGNIKLINSYYQERIEKSYMVNFNEQETIHNSFISWISEVNKNQNEVEKSLKSIYGTNLKLLGNYKIDYNYIIPSPKRGYMILFKNKQKTNFISFHNKEGDLKAIDLEKNEDIQIFKLLFYINVEEKVFHVFCF